MPAKRFTGKTESDAVMNAAMELGIPSTDLTYKVIDAGSNGILGLFKKPVIIEMTDGKEEVKPAKEDKKPVENKKPKEKAKEPKEEKEIVVPENIDDIVKDTEKYLMEVLTNMGLEPKLNLYYKKSDNMLNINVAGEKMGALIGKHGQTLDALQYLTSLYVNRESESFIKVRLDTENYRERRQQTLEKLAGSIAGKVKRTRKPIHLEPMNPYERRIIHSSLQKDPEITTKSEGKDPYRKVVVMLKK